MHTIAQKTNKNKTGSHEASMHMIAASIKQTIDTVKIAVLIYQDVVLQDFAGPIEVFSKAKKLTRNKYEVFTVSIDGALLSTENNLVKVKPDYSIYNMPDADYLIIPGASMPVINHLIKHDIFKEFITDWNQKQHTKTVSVCTGSYLLANTKALNNKRATTHYFVADDFSKQFPKITLVKNVRFVDEGKYITSSGITSGIDVSLYIVGKNSGEKIKGMISRAMQYRFKEIDDWPVAPNGMTYQRPKP